MAAKPAPKFGGKASVEVGGPALPGETRIRRSSLFPDGLVERPADGVDTVTDCLLYAARKFNTKNAMGYRDIVSIVEEEKEIKKVVDGKETVQKKTWKYFQLSDYKYITYIELRDAVSEVSKGLVELGVERGQVVNIFAQTSHTWQIFAHGCAAVGTVFATAYDTLGESGLTHSLNEPECVGIFTNADLLPIFSRVLPNVPTVSTVVYDGEPAAGVLDKIKAVREGVRVLSLDELRALGRGSTKNVEDRLPTRTDTVCIMYTSGTTGNPKGVVLSHGNLVSAVGGVYQLLGHHLRSDDTILHYLPLAHILEYIVELLFLFVGVTAGYGRVKTLTDASVRNCLGDLGAFRPSIMVGVPAVFELIRKGIVGAVAKKGRVASMAFNAAVAAKQHHIPVLAEAGDALVLKAVRKGTGGRLRLAMSGGAAISRSTQEFLNAALVNLLQGYGMTESCGMCTILPPEFMAFERVGALVPCIEAKLRDVPEAGYRSTNKLPQGEILIRGEAVTKGYYKRPDLNSDASIFGEDGWFRTGDVGQWNADGTLSVIDRIKNLVKLSGGEYIALERLESTYRACPLVANLCVIANADARAPIAVIVVHEANLRGALGADHHEDLHELCKRPEARARVLRDANAAGKEAGFKPMELLAAVILTADEWTPESGLVTAAQKVQRKKVEEKFAAEIKQAFASTQGGD